MQTFLPSPDFHECARVLDDKRLGKQIVECRQIMRTLLGLSSGWRNHPAVKMWAGCEYALWQYAVEMHSAWVANHRKSHAAYWSMLADVMDSPILCQIDLFAVPPWLGDERVHSSHRANLLRKDPVHYGQFGWTEEPQEGYFWPVGVDKESANAR